ncbi:DUF305 domain-containing protein [Streptomyces ficellus]|uniref:DUF305 domain-containing protein n=1 Tax=Streptomyces ficellus TaxID=1977088 RepID=A0ABT7Z198_9ACTN|nr:DUF305 domain-containing protein [Streptomyces ficellus]MDN3292886.1 DUF305 domain-containing protein [Streptomyces ficellus]
MLKRSRSVVAAATLAVVLALGACESAPSGPGDEPQPKANGATGTTAGSGGPGVVAPGKPGEPARTLSPEEAAKAVPPDTPNAADFMYTQMMIVHHGQALEMTALAPKQAASAQVKALAARIAAAQQPEIGAMRGWLKSNGGPRAQTGHDHGTMPGMATKTQLAQLRAARGAAFDQLFLTLMIVHHEGAVSMATEVLSQGNNVQVEEMANDVIAQQTAEINRMRSM